MKKGAGILIIFCLIISSVLVSASFKVGNVSHSIDKSYAPSASVKGWVNISFEEEPVESIFSDSFGNNISIIGLLKKNQSYDYSCTTNDCSPDYSANNGEGTKTFVLNTGESRIIGLKLDKEIISINSIDFLINSDADSSCISQLKVDFLSDGTQEFANKKSVEGDCSFVRDYGCFNSSKTSENYVIGRVPNRYCQRVTIPEAPALKLGAWVKNNNDSRDVKISLYRLNGESVEGANCILPDVEGEETSCSVNYSVINSEDYYICVSSDTDGTSEIRGYESSNGCGFYGIGIKSENAAYQIFAEGKKFDSVGTININNYLSGGDTLSGNAEDYLFEKYGSLNCSEVCIIPIKIISKKNQEVTLSDLKLKYETDLGIATETRFYDVEGTTAKVTSDFQKLFLDKGGFILPSSYGNFSFKLELNSNNVFSEKITVEKAPEINYLTPVETASAYPTKFRVNVKSFVNVTKYEWDFGDWDIQTTTKNEATHTYNQTGKYELKVTVTDAAGRSAYKIFEINVESPKEMINKTIAKMQKDLTNINEELGKYNAFEQKILKEAMDFDAMSDKLKQVKKDYSAASSETDYNKIMTSILEIKIPESVIISKAGDKLTFYPMEEVINLEILKKLGGGDYESSKERNYVKGAILWHEENVDIDIKFTEFSAEYTNYEEPVARVFDINIKKKNPGVEDAYIILEKIENMEFKENYFEEEESGYVSIKLSREEANIVLSTTEEVDFTNLPLFVSPKIESLPLVEIEEGEEEKPRWGLLTAIIILLLIIGLAVYIVLQEWYRRRYENYLFKNRNDFYNIITYIQTSREKEVEDSKISSKLRKAGWSSEQVNYAMRRYSGKRTGMLEIPVRKIFDIFRKNRDVNAEYKNKPPQNY